MKIGYVKKVKKTKKNYKNYINNIIIDIKSFFNFVEQDKNKKDIFYVYNFNNNSKKKLKRKIEVEKIDFVLVENKYELEFAKLDTKFSIQGMLPELAEQCYKLVEPRLNEIYICTNIFCEDNIAIIRELVNKVKTVNVVTNNRKYHSLESRLEEQGIFITVSNNKRKSLKNANIVINLDFPKLTDYNVNREMVLIDITGKICIQKAFNGIIINRIKIRTNKVLRVFSEFESFDKNELLEAELAKLNNYSERREFIKFNKIYIEELYNNRKIKLEEFDRIKTINKEKNKKKGPPDSQA